MLRRPLPSAAAPAAPVLPADVRLMNAVAAGVVVLALGVLAAAALQWLARAPWFAIRALSLGGELARSQPAAVRAEVLPRLQGNFFSIDLAAARAAFEALPWVRQAVVRRVWPDRLAVTLQEHRPVALWQRDEENPLIVNSHGELFEANLGEIDDAALPVFAGPPETSAEMWALYQRLQPLLAAQSLSIGRLELSGRGSWRVRTTAGQPIELGRGSADELLARSAAFARTVAQVTGRYGRPLASADLRHAGGYAVRLEGVTTAPAGEGGPRGEN
jgi:cell division protein FtsQ